MTIPPQKTPWFSRDEYTSRVQKVQATLRERGFDALIAFLPESVTYLTGFFTRGYTSFQFAIIPVDAEPIVVCRDVEKYYLDTTCVYSGHYLWSDGRNPMNTGVRAIRDTLGSSSSCVIELEAWPLTASRFASLEQGLPGTRFVDGSAIVSDMCLIKSPAEIAYQREAGIVAESGMKAAIETAVAGASERDVAAAICSAIILAGGERPGPGILSSGDRALYLHGAYTDRVLAPRDLVQVEVTPSVRYYNARFMRPIKAGQATQEDHDLVSQLIAIQDRALNEVGPEVPAALPDSIYREGIVNTGLVERYTNKTFYGLGCHLDPNDGEYLEAAPGCTWRFKSGMTFHTYLLVCGFGISETITITDSGYDRLTQFPRRLFVT